MPTLHTPSRLVAVGACCAAAGAGIGTVAAAGAATNPSAHHASALSTGARHRRRSLRGLTRRAVTGQITVHTRAGFQSLRFERGTVTAVSGDRLTLAVGTRAATDTTDTVTVGADARVRDNGARAQLSSVTTGQRAFVVQLPKRTVVIVRTPKSAGS